MGWGWLGLEFGVLGGKLGQMRCYVPCVSWKNGNQKVCLCLDFLAGFSNSGPYSTGALASTAAVIQVF